MNEADILHLIESDEEMMDIVRIVDMLHLPDWAIGAGFVRNKVWDALHGYAHKTPPTDIDVVFFDNHNSYNEQEIQDQLRSIRPGLKWEVVNQATAHTFNEEKPYVSTADALSKWPETATAIGLTIQEGKLHLIAPNGITDLVHMIVRPTPAFVVSAEKQAKIRDRVFSKQWKEKWPKLELRID